MNQLQVIVHENRRVLTTKQIAESYGTTADKVSYNFKYNENRYEEGKHFFLLEGESLKSFKNANREFQGSLNKLYLWTEKGAWLHAKSLNTDEAWDAYELLVDEYYKVIEQKKLTEREKMQLVMKVTEEAHQRLDTVEKEIFDIKDNQRMSVTQEYELKEVGKNRVIEVLGGKNSEAYKNLSRSMFQQLWGDFKKHFKLPRYNELKAKDFESGLKFASKWQPETSKVLIIEELNSQLKLL